MRRVMEAVSGKLNHDPNRPQTWSVAQLLEYARKHKIEVVPGSEKPDLAKLVDEHMTNELLRAELKKQATLKENRVDVLTTPAEELLAYKPLPSYAAPLRHDVGKLKGIIEAGMRRLSYPKAIADLRNTELHPAVEAWLYVAATGTDDGKALHDVLTLNSTSSVCGKYFNSKDMVVRCLDCGADPTCVLCMECFQHSPCRNHRYAVTPGSGGGMCDCGDPTAWKPESFCTRHRGVKEGDDPTAGMAPADKAWVSTILRGMVQFVTLVLQQSLALDRKLADMREGKKGSRREQRHDVGGGGGDGPLSATEESPTLTAEEEDLTKILPYLSNRDWVADWLLPVAKALLSLTGDCAKRLVGSMWTEPTPLPSAAIAASAGEREATCLEVLFLYQLHRDKVNGRVSEKRDAAWWNTLLQSVGSCLSDPVFRVPFAALHFTYAERMEQSGGRLRGFSVQFMTSPATIRSLTLASPSLLPYKSPHDTILHRSLAALMYLFAKIARDPESDKSRKLPDVLPPWLFRLRWSTNELSAAAATPLSHVMTSCKEAAAAAVLSRSFLRVWLHVLVLLHGSADIRKDPEGTRSGPCDAHWIGNFLNRVLWRMQSAQRRVLRQLANGKGFAADESSSRLLAVLEKCTAFDTAPDRGVQCVVLADFLSGAGALAPEESAVLPLEATPHAARVYADAYLAEILRAVDMAMLLQRTDFQKVGSTNSDTVLARSQASINAYHLMEPAGHSTTFLNQTVRALCLAVRAWVMEQRGLQLQARGTHAEGHASAAHVRLRGLDLNSLLKTPPPPPLADITGAIFAGEANVVRRESVLDSLVMPFALMSQLELGWWLRGDCNVMSLMEHYMEVETGMALYQDVYMLQVLTMHTPPLDFALRVLERFSFEKSADASDRKRWQRIAARGGKRCGGALASPRPGWAKFLRLMITLVTDTTKANRVFTTEFSPHLVRQIVSRVLAASPVPHSRIVASVQICLRGLDSDEADTDEEGNSVQKLAHQVIRELAVAEEGPQGSVFHLKSTSVWRENVSMYGPGMTDAELDDAFLSSYSRLHIMEQIQQRKAAGEGDSSSEEKLRTPRLPPTTLRAGQQYEELIPSLRALLHTDAMLVTAIEIILQHAHNLRKLRAGGVGVDAWRRDEETAHTGADTRTFPEPRHGESSGSSSGSSDGTAVEDDSDSDNENENEEEEDHERGPAHTTVRANEEASEEEEESEAEKHHVPAVLLCHAITTLYLCVQDCVAITQAAAAEVGVVHSNSSNSGATAPGEVPMVDWGRVESYIRDVIAPSCSFRKESVKRLFTLPELTGPQCVKAKLARKVAVSRFSKPITGAAAADPSSAGQKEQMFTAAQALHDIRQYFRDNEKEDKYSFGTMIEYVLLGTGLAEFPPQPSDEEVAANARAAADAKSRQQRVKDKQAKLLAQLRSRGAKKSAAVAGVAGSAEARKVGEEEKAHAAESATPQVHTKLLLELASLECCVCRAATEEPLMLLANTSSSGVLSLLGPMPLPDERNVHSHFHVCGHAAHKSCTEKLFKRLSQLWQRGMFQGERFLGAGEFSCPVCVMICTALCPVPVLSTAPHSSPAGHEKATTLFEDIRRSTLQGKSKVLENACADLHNALANACVGTSFAGEASAPIARSEDALQKTGSYAWQLSETIRSVGFHLQLMLETVKAKLNTAATSLQRDCIALLSLLVSIDPSALAKHKGSLESNFTRTREDFSLLVLRVLLEPRKATALIAAYAAALAASSPPLFQSLLDACATPAAAPHGSECAQGEDGVAESGPESVIDVDGVDIVLWKELGCLTLLKLMVSDEDGASSAALVVAPIPATGNAQQQQQQLTFVTLDGDALGTASGRRDAIRRMWSFVRATPASASAPSASPAGALPRLSQLPLLPAAHPGLSRYTSPEDYRRAILETVMHMPAEYMDILSWHAATHNACSQCHKQSQKPVMCCYCAKQFCLQPEDSEPELFEHSRTCGGGVGLYVIIRATVTVVLDAVASRVVQNQPVYTDEHGETDTGLMRGRRLTRNEAAANRLLALWLRNRWGVDSSTVKQSLRYIAKRM